MKNLLRIFPVLIGLLSANLMMLEHVQAEENPGPAVAIKVQVEPEQVLFSVTNSGSEIILRENLIVEQWDEKTAEWRFAAAPLWQCASKESVSAKPLPVGGQIEINWRRKLHKACSKAGPGRYRVLIRDNPETLQVLPVEFELAATVATERNLEYKETRYRISSDGCILTWEIRDNELGVSLARSTCSLSLKEQAPLIANLLEVVLQSGSLPRSDWSLYWGRLGPSKTSCLDLSKRLMLAAHLSRNWDAKRGRCKKGDENAFVRSTANQAGIYQELKTVFNAQGLDIQVSDVEKVLVLKAKDLPCYPELKLLGVGPEEKLPFDCQTWFRVIPLNPNSDG